MLDPELLNVLRCPETQQPLRVAELPLVESLNQAIAAATLRNRAGKILVETLESGLVRSDGKVLYPVRDGIATLLVEEAVPLGEVPGA